MNLRLIKKKDLNHGVIASELCSEYYNLNILKKDIQKVSKNFTRFLIVVNREEIPSQIDEEKTSLAFTTNNDPGSLMNCLQVFYDAKINLTKIESQPIPEDPFMYIFYIDCEIPYHNKNMKECIQNLSKNTSSIRIIGSYPIHKII